MKKIVDGLLYDTDKSELIYTDVANKRRLFKTENNRFFIVYNNGEIVPKTEQNAKDYLGERDIDKYIELFGEVENA